MNGVASYILTVVTAAMVAAILRKMAAEGAAGALIRMLSGIFLALTIISPLLKLELPDSAGWILSYTEEADAAAAVGVEMEMEARRSFITAQTRAYILDKAAAIGVSPTVTVELDAELIPVRVTLEAQAARHVKDQLTRSIMESLDLGEEGVIWIEANQ